MRRLAFGIVLVGACTLALAYGCVPDLGDAPFLCNPGSPRCPTGYVCNAADVCVREGVCPAGVAGCSSGKCGDGKCEGGETCSSCEQDCGKCTGNCGDGKCEGGETCSSCEQDCGKCTGNCGDGKCEGGETCTSCEKDCGKCPSSCGNTTCDAGETTANCPQDCPPPNQCTDGDTKCLDTDTLEYCDQGAKKTDKCDVICATQFDYAVGCRLNPQTSKDICMCANFAKFGELCDNDIKCDTGLFCGSFGATSSQGFCSKYCSNPGGLCTGGPVGAEARCNLNVGGQDACGFDCQSLFSTCPTGLTCDSLAGICKP